MDRQYLYRALVTEEEVQQSMVSELTERLFAGDVAALVNHLLTSQDIAPGDLDRLRAMIDTAEARKEDR
jgi:predicted transcriptional regulator